MKSFNMTLNELPRNNALASVIPGKTFNLTGLSDDAECEDIAKAFCEKFGNGNLYVAGIIFRDSENGMVKLADKNEVYYNLCYSRIA